MKGIRKYMEIKNKLEFYIKNEKPFDDIIKLLIDAKNDGIKQIDVYNSVKELRNELDNKYEECILDVADIVCVWCHPDQYIWPKPQTS